LVGSECADDLSGCRNPCAANGNCAVDGGYDLGALGSGNAEAGPSESGSVSPGLDATTPLDSAASPDQGSETSSAAIDLDDSEARAATDTAKPRSDGAPDLAADKTAPAERQEVARADAIEAAPVDTNNRQVDSRDVVPPTPDTRDSASPPSLDLRDARDARVTPDAAETPPPPAEVGRDARQDTTVTCPGCTDAQESASPVDTMSLDLSEPDTADASTVGFDGLAVDIGPDGPATCPVGQVPCGGRCTDTLVDIANCGGCGQGCAADQACRFGSCITGQIVVIGHDFQTYSDDMRRLLGNAVFLPNKDVTFAEYGGKMASAIAVSNAHQVITKAESETGHKAIRIDVSDGSIATQLPAADVFLIHSQVGATNTILLRLGQSWATALATFVRGGGIIVLLDGYADFSINAGTVQILAAAGLTNIAATDVVNGDACSVTTAGATDPVAKSVAATYTCPQNTYAFSGDGVPVVTDLGHPVVLHLTVR
jgi:hypothetical protein